MGNEEILKEVKDLLMISDDSVDRPLMLRMLAVRDYMKNAGVSEAVLQSYSGVLALSIGVNDTWNAPPGEAKFSPGFLNMATQLQAKSM